jgi:hypothetical protein
MVRTDIDTSVIRRMVQAHRQACVRLLSLIASSRRLGLLLLPNGGRFQIMRFAANRQSTIDPEVAIVAACR